MHSRNSKHGVPGVAISVSDNGGGVPENIRKFLRQAGQGTGLGLALSIKIVQEHGGTLVVDDDPELGGARFTLASTCCSGGIRAHRRSWWVEIRMITDS